MGKSVRKSLPAGRNLEKNKERRWEWSDDGPAALSTAEPEAVGPQWIKQLPVRAAGVPSALESLLTWSCLCLALPKCCSEWLLCCWLALRAVWVRGWACTVLWRIRHTSHASDSSCSLCRQESSSGRRMRSSTTGTNCATGLLFLLPAKVRCDSVTLISLSASAARYIPEGTARGQSGQPPAAEAPAQVSRAAVVLCSIIPAPSKPRELLSFGCLSWCP